MRPLHHRHAAVYRFAGSRDSPEMKTLVDPMTDRASALTKHATGPTRCSAPTERATERRIDVGIDLTAAAAAAAARSSLTQCVPVQATILSPHF